DRLTCVKCMSADSDPATSCATVVAECNKFTTCGGTLACTLKSCVGASFSDFIACVNVCVKENGLIGGAPGSEISVSVYHRCAITPCRSKCIIDPVQPGEDGGPTMDSSLDGDAGAEETAPPACVVPEGTPNNEKGIGGSCKTGADCDQDAGLRLCTADY